jgi:ATP-dependent Zn protease
MDDQLSLADAKLAWRIALHEAGHCVAARLMGLPVSGASVEPDNAYADFPDRCGVHSIVALMAGAISERLVLGGNDEHGASDDCARWTRLMDDAGYDDEALWAWTFALLAQHVDVIERVAAALLHAQTLDQAEIDALIAQ